MPLLDFGQPLGGIVQTAYVVPDIEQAIGRWVATMGVGPWRLFERFTGPNPRYRGEPTEAAVSIAMAFAGSMQIELIQPLDDLPTVYKETIDARGYGFHHWGVAAADLAAEITRYEAMGFEQAWTIGPETGDVIVYMDSKGALPGFVELFSGANGLEQFRDLYLASVGWKGENPVRPVE